MKEIYIVMGIYDDSYDEESIVIRAFYSNEKALSFIKYLEDNVNHWREYFKDTDRDYEYIVQNSRVIETTEGIFDGLYELRHLNQYHVVTCNICD